jgi:DNA-binding transcriptional regulator YiaG
MSKLLESWRWRKRLSKAELGRMFGVSRQLVQSWIDKGKLPEGWIDTVSEMTGIDKNKLKKESGK